MKTKTVKIIYIKMLKFKINQDEHVNKIKLNTRFSKKIQIAGDLNGITVKGITLNNIGTVKLEIRRQN